MLLYVDHMNPRRPIEMFFRGHLWVERVLTSLLRDSLKRPDAINIDQLRFDSKLQLLVAIGAIDHPEAEVLKNINKIRNRLAHEFDSYITVRDLVLLEASLKGIPKVVTKQAKSTGSGPLERLQRVFELTLGDLEFRRIYQEYERDNAAAIHSLHILRGLHEQSASPFDEAGMKAKLGIPDPPSYEEAWFVDFEADRSYPDALQPEDE